ncbi:MAG: hypothetical protein H8D87_11830 [Deltaproteobacteria bacterium]|nr:hypothetical protein [Candidatus Desulfobacula maris]
MCSKRDRICGKAAQGNERKIKDVKDLALLPFATKQELRNSQKRLAPFGDFLAASAEKVSRVHRTSGTTGSFIYTALTKQDLDRTHNCCARAFWAELMTCSM